MLNHQEGVYDYTQLAQQWGIEVNDPIILLLREFDLRFTSLETETTKLSRSNEQWSQVMGQLLEIFREQKADEEIKTNVIREMTDAISEHSQSSKSLGMGLQKIERLTEALPLIQQQLKSILPQLTAISESLSSDGSNAKTVANKVKADLERIEATLGNIWKGLSNQIEASSAKFLRTKTIQGNTIWLASVVAALALLLAFAGGFWNGGYMYHQQDIADFGGEESYHFAEQLMKRADNTHRFIKCQNDQNPKCTVWIQDPS